MPRLREWSQGEYPVILYLGGRVAAASLASYPG